MDEVTLINIWNAKRKSIAQSQLIDYCLRKLGAPVLEVNVAQEQIEDLVDDAVQLF